MGQDYPFGYRGGFDLPVQHRPDEAMIKRMTRWSIERRQVRIRRQLERAYFEQFYEEEACEASTSC